MASQLWAAFASLTLSVGGVVLLFSALQPPPPQQRLDRRPQQRHQLLVPALDAGGCDATHSTALLVTSHAAHAATRDAHRRAYPAALLRALGVRRVFLLARQEAAEGWAAVEAEGRRHGDVVAGGFREAYRNLTLKHLMGLRWAASRCPRAALVVKMDDDVVADLHRALPLLRAPSPPPPLAGYPLRGAAPSRDPRSKWFVTRAEFPGDAYPDFLSGWFYATTPDAARRLVGAALAQPPGGGAWFWIDDVFVTGVLARGAGLPGAADLSAVFAAHSGFLECCVAAPRFSCEFLVGPDGGDAGLQERFQRHAARCAPGGGGGGGGCPRRDVAGTCVRKVEAAQGPGAGRVGVASVARLRVG